MSDVVWVHDVPCSLLITVATWMAFQSTCLVKRQASLTMGRWHIRQVLRTMLPLFSAEGSYLFPTVHVCCLFPSSRCLCAPMCGQALVIVQGHECCSSRYLIIPMWTAGRRVRTCKSHVTTLQVLIHCSARKVGVGGISIYYSLLFTLAWVYAI